MTRMKQLKLSGISNKETRAFVRHLCKEHGVTAYHTNSGHLRLEAEWMPTPYVTGLTGGYHQSRHIIKGLKDMGLNPCRKCPR